MITYYNTALSLINIQSLFIGLNLYEYCKPYKEETFLTCKHTIYILLSSFNYSLFLTRTVMVASTIFFDLVVTLLNINLKF